MMSVTRNRLHWQTAGSAVVPPRGRSRREICARAVQAASVALSLRAGACTLPHPDKLATGGEDAYFISEDAKVMGVADGVGGWRESGVDPGEYSRTLMRVACEFFNTGQDKEREDGLEETTRAALAVAHQKTRMPGSSTACILALNPEESAVSASNLGDSGFVVIRNGTVVYQTDPQLHYFDCPFQLGAYPEHVDATNYPSDADTCTVTVISGDTIVLGTDGLWDNCPLEEITQMIPDTDDAVNTAAEVLATAAREHADDPEYDSPYVQAAREEGLDLPWYEKVAAGKFENGKFSFKRLTGGKLDDITVVVARVTDAPPVEEVPVTAEASEIASDVEAAPPSVSSETEKPAAAAASQSVSSEEEKPAAASEKSEGQQ